MVIAAIFWLKARGRWKETSVNEHSGLDGKPIEQVHEIRRIHPSRSGSCSLGRDSCRHAASKRPVTLWDADAAE